MRTHHRNHKQQRHQATTASPTSRPPHPLPTGTLHHLCIIPHLHGTALRGKVALTCLLHPQQLLPRALPPPAPAPAPLPLALPPLLHDPARRPDRRQRLAPISIDRNATANSRHAAVPRRPDRQLLLRIRIRIRKLRPRKRPSRGRRREDCRLRREARGIGRRESFWRAVRRRGFLGRRPDGRAARAVRQRGNGRVGGIGGRGLLAGDERRGHAAAAAAVERRSGCGWH